MDRTFAHLALPTSGLGAIRDGQMPNGLWNKADYYRQLVDECLALARAATSNEIRAECYAAAEYYLHLAEVEANLAGWEGDTTESLRESIGVNRQIDRTTID
jgi:hypothetical protein